MGARDAQVAAQAVSLRGPREPDAALLDVSLPVGDARPGFAVRDRSPQAAIAILPNDETRAEAVGLRRARCGARRRSGS